MSSYFASENHGLAHELKAHAAELVHVFNLDLICKYFKIGICISRRKGIITPFWSFFIRPLRLIDMFHD